MKYIITTLLLSCSQFLSSTAFANQAGESTHLSVSTDSLTWLIDGYSFIGTYQKTKKPSFRWHVETFGINIPASYIDSYKPNTGEKWRRSIDWAVMLSVDYHPFEHLNGFHIGLGVNYQQTTVSRQSMEKESTFDVVEPILRTGFQWFPLKNQGLFITPYLVVGTPIMLTLPAPISGQRYEEALILPVASCQIGWSFPL